MTKKETSPKRCIICGKILTLYDMMLILYKATEYPYIPKPICLQCATH